MEVFKAGTRSSLSNDLKLKGLTKHAFASTPGPSLPLLRLDNLQPIWLWILQVAVGPELANPEARGV